MNSAEETLDTAKLCIENKRYKDAINRCYYATFYAVKAVIALEEIDFNKQKEILRRVSYGKYINTISRR
jgi:uncharacterized protein (UPF0332 family)